MITRRELVKLTGVSRAQYSNVLAKLVKRGYLAPYRSKRHYYLTSVGSRYIDEFYRDVFDVVLAMYDDNE